MKVLYMEAISSTDKSGNKFTQYAYGIERCQGDEEEYQSFLKKVVKENAKAEVEESKNVVKVRIPN